jgi:hypothetical protein
VARGDRAEPAAGEGIPGEQDGGGERDDAEAEPGGPGRVDQLTVAGAQRDQQRPQQLRGDRGGDERHEGQAEAGEGAGHGGQAAAAGQEHQGGDGEQREGGDRPGERGRVAQQQAGEREVDRVAGGGAQQRREVGAAEVAGEGEGVVAVVLQAGLVHRRRPVERAVIDAGPVDVGGVEAGEARLRQERGEVGVVGQQPVDLHGEAGADRVRGVGIDVDEVGVADGRLEHDGGAAAAAGLEVEHDGRFLAQRVPADERLGAAEAGLLGVGEQEHDVVAGFRAGGQGAGDLEQGAGAGAVVVGAVADLDGVVVGEQDDLAGGGGPGQHRDDVADAGHAAGAELAGVDPHGVLDLGAQPVTGEGRHDVLADPVGGGAAGDVDLLADCLDVGERAGGGEVAGGCRGGAGRRWLDVGDAEEREQGQGEHGRGGREGSPRRCGEASVGQGVPPVGCQHSARHHRQKRRGKARQVARTECSGS